MSSGLMHTDWYTDPPWERVSLVWLINYVRNIRVNPALSKALSAEKEQFEMVPMPRDVIAHLASARMTTASTGNVERFASQRASEQVLEIINKFSSALSDRQLEQAVSFLSPSYQDANGRDSAAIRRDLKKLLAAASSFRLAPCPPESLFVVGDFLVANLMAAWEGDIKKGKKVEHKRAFSQIELVLKRTSRDAETWEIVGIRTI